MKRILAAAALAAAAAGSVSSALAAEGPTTATTVKVALLDMSSTLGLGTVGMMGPGMMGPGMMGRWGPGPWWQDQGQPGTDGGSGMMGPRQPGPQMMPRWGMGPGMMMGMMSIRIDRAEVKAGAVTFDITNWSRSAVHELAIVPVDGPDAPLPYDFSQAQVAEDQVSLIAETEEMKPNASATLEVTLMPGTYLLICNIPGHYAAGMAVPLTVAP
ncbi:MAG: hypothetical protein IRY94_01285 [Rhodospirillaceae bacterium]|nr:hypothetical protein [Rhodospirillaceae bacterium]